MSAARIPLVHCWHCLLLTRDMLDDATNGDPFTPVKYPAEGATAVEDSEDRSDGCFDCSADGCAGVLGDWVSLGEGEVSAIATSPTSGKGNNSLKLAGSAAVEDSEGMGDGWFDCSAIGCVDVLTEGVSSDEGEVLAITTSPTSSEEGNPWKLSGSTAVEASEGRSDEWFGCSADGCADASMDGVSLGEGEVTAITTSPTSGKEGNLWKLLSVLADLLLYFDVLLLDLLLSNVLLYFGVPLLDLLLFDVLLYFDLPFDLPFDFADLLWYKVSVSFVALASIHGD